MIAIAGAGDIFMSDRMPRGSKALDGVRKLLRGHDVAFANLECTVHDNEGFPSAFPGGGWAMAPAQVLPDIMDLGVNLVSVANNHAMDYCHPGLVATLRNLDEVGLAHAGAGMNLAEAARPGYVEVSGARVALVAATSSFHDSDAAGSQGTTVSGRPGVNPLRHTEVLEVTEDLAQAVATIMQETGINDYRNHGMRNGYLAPGAELRLRDVNFRVASEVRKVSEPLKKDAERICLGIREAREQADCVILSLHGHQFKGSDSVPDDFIVEMCRQAADAGAHVVFCHGGHEVRGVELYQQSVICYGLGDFVMKNELQLDLPADFMERYDVDPALAGCPGLAMSVRSHGGTVGMCANPRVWESFVASIDFDGEMCGVRLHPVDLHFDLPRSRRGWPELMEGERAEALLSHVDKLSRPFGTAVDADGTVRAL